MARHESKLKLPCGILKISVDCVVGRLKEKITFLVALENL